MPKKTRNNVDTTFRDSYGNAIEVHSYLSDESGRLYFVNSHCQAVPQTDEDAPAVPLADFLRDNKVRALSPEDVMEVGKGAQAPRARREKPQEQAVQEKKAEEVKQSDIEAEIALVIQSIPDNVLADELRRRGYHLTATKPAFVCL